MQILIDSYKRNGGLHHAYAFEGDADTILLSLIPFFEKQLKFIAQANPDYRYEKYETFGIDEARNLSLMQMKKSLSGGKKIFVIATQGMTLEAQNALLKVFEEPTPDTHFFLILDSFERLIPTLRSRIFFVSKMRGDEKVFLEKGKEFLASSVAERMTLINPIGEEKNPKQSDGQRGARPASYGTGKKEARELLHGIEAGLHEALRKEENPEIIFSLNEVLRVKHYLEDRAPSVKMILEHIAHITPVV